MYKIFAGTPPIQHLYGLTEALDMIDEEGGLEPVWARHTALADRHPRRHRRVVDRWRHRVQRHRPGGEVRRRDHGPHRRDQRPGDAPTGRGPSAAWWWGWDSAAWTTPSGSGTWATSTHPTCSAPWARSRRHCRRWVHRSDRAVSPQPPAASPPTSNPSPPKIVPGPRFVWAGYDRSRSMSTPPAISTRPAKAPHEHSPTTTAVPGGR